MDWLDIKEFFKDIFKYILVIAIMLFILTYVVSMQQVVGPSMEPKLMANDMLLIEKITPRFFDFKRNDIISFEYEDTKYLIKRIVGLPGEKIEYKNNYLYINDEAYQENFLKETQTEDFSIIDMGYEVIPEDMYLVLGDNRNDSLDSRDFGLIRKENIIGKVWIRLWPLID